MASSASKKIRVGIIGAGEVAQVIHIPTLILHSHLFEIKAIADVNSSLAAHCSLKFHIPTHTSSPSEIIKNPEVDLVFILASDPFHESLCISALQAGKKIFIEKPLSLSLLSVQRILKAEQEAGGNKIFVGYMRRYAKTFTDVFLKEVNSIDRILYARVRDIIGPNSHFVGQSGTYPIKGSEEVLSPSLAKEGTTKLRDLVAENYEGSTSQEVSDEEIGYCRFLCGLGSHDFSLMREAIGFPDNVETVSANGTGFYTAMFRFRNSGGNKEPFTCLYESGIDKVPRFDAHLAVYGKDKSVQIDYDTPYVKGLAIKVIIEEKGAIGERVRREVVGSLEDAYTSQLQELWSWVVEGKAVKTSAVDAEGEARLVGLMMRRLREQEGAL